MKITSIFAGLLAAAGVGVAIFAFVANSSPYVSVAVATERPGVPVHIAGRLIHESAHNNLLSGVFEFEIEDDAGDVILVVYLGTKPANFDSAPTASVSGYYEDGAFHAHAVKTQCPSKYESEKEHPR